MKVRSYAAAAFMAAAGLSYADAPAPEAPPVTDWSMEVVHVEGHTQGPALWHLKKGDSEIYILGTVGAMPKDLVWNKTQLESVIDGANQVLLPPEAKTGFFGIFEMSWFLVTHWGVLSMPDGQKLEESLQPDLRARFVADREFVGEKADKYEDRKPLVAGFMLIGDLMKKDNLAASLPEDAVTKIARAKHVKVERVAEYDAMPLVKEMLKLGPAEGMVCFENELKDFDTARAHAVPAAEAWADGNIAGIKANYSTGMAEGCIKQAKKFGEIDARAVNDMLKAVHAALAKPGKTLMLIDVGWMFRATGVADQLRQEGVTIEGPAE